MTSTSDKPVVPYENPEWVPVLPTRWVAEYDGEVAGAVDRTPRGKYRATDRNSRRVGTFRTLADARDALAEKNSTTAIQRMNQSRSLLVIGLVAFLATATVAAVAIFSLLLQ